MTENNERAAYSIRRAAASPSPTTPSLPSSGIAFRSKADCDNAIHDLGETNGSTLETPCQNPKFPPSAAPHVLCLASVDDRFGERLRGLLRQIVANPARNEPVLVSPREFAAIGCGVGMGRAVGVAFHGNCRYCDDGPLSEFLFQIVVFPLAVGEVEPPAVIVDHDGGRGQGCRRPPSCGRRSRRRSPIWARLAARCASKSRAGFCRTRHRRARWRDDEG